MRCINGDGLKALGAFWMWRHMYVCEVSGWNSFRLSFLSMPRKAPSKQATLGYIYIYVTMRIIYIYVYTGSSSALKANEVNLLNVISPGL